MKYVSQRLLLVSFLLVAVQTTLCTDKKPKLTVIIMVDQFAYHYIPKLSPHLKYGLKHLMKHGINYTNAYIPHGIPATGTGHAGLNTGTFAKDHGIIKNTWIDENGKKVACDDDTAERAAVIAPHGQYEYGKSPRNIMVDGISDQFMLAAQPDEKHHVFSVSLKSRAAIGAANKLGKAMWFDDKSGNFTSSTAYFEQLPDWLVQFNKKHHINKLEQIEWKLIHSKKSSAYRYYNTDNYAATQRNKEIAGTTITLDNHKNDYELFFKTPQANKLVFDLAKECVKTYLQKNDNDQMLLWVCIGGLDKIGHSFGTETIEAIDMIYHLDKQLEKFIKFVQNHVGKDEVLFVFTADHGGSPIPENMQQRGLSQARRIDPKQLITGTNQLINEKYGVDNVMLAIKQPNCYLDIEKLNKLKPSVRQKILLDIKLFLRAQPGIKEVWTYRQLQNSCFAPDQIENFFKQQLFPGRSGHIIIQTYPYVVITKYPGGSTHNTPYEYDTHVPLVIYQPDQFEAKAIHKKVWNLQLANTLADILSVQKPSASTFDLLPGVL